MARILVVDDDLNLLQMVRLMLERVGHEVETTNKGAEGIARAAQMKPDLAIIDIMMPDLDGYNVVRRMRADPATARIPILVLTARSQEMDKQTAMRAGANAFLSKPVTAQQLTERVNSVLEMGVDYHVHTGLLTEPMDLENARQPIGAEPLSQQPDTHDNGTPLRNVLAVASLRGGSGGTTLAVNLGMVLARQGQRVALVDLSATGGQIGLHLRLPTPQHWGALLGMEHLPDADHVLALLTVHAIPGRGSARPRSRLSGRLRTSRMLWTPSAHFDTTLVDISTLDENPQPRCKWRRRCRRDGRFARCRRPNRRWRCRRLSARATASHSVASIHAHPAGMQRAKRLCGRFPITQSKVRQSGEACRWSSRSQVARTSRRCARCSRRSRG